MRRIAALAVFSSVLVACDGRPRIADVGSGEEALDAGAGSGTLLEFDLSQGLPESPESGLLFSLPASRTYTGLVRAVERARNDGEAAGYILRFGGEGFDFAQSEELGALFADLRKKTGKPALCHAHSLSNATAWFAAQACSDVWVSPAGSIETVGIAGQLVFLKSALEKVKVRADFVSMGTYKSAAETLTRDEPSDAARENLTSVLKSMRTTWLDGASAARGEKVRDALEHGPYGPERGVEVGIADSVGHESEALSSLKERSKSGKLASRFGRGRKRSSRPDIGTIVRLIAGDDGRTREPHIAVVPAEGSITMASGGLLSEGGITARAFKRTIRRLGDDDTVRAVVLRIDSPGGSALASEIIWHELMQLRKKKPVVASVGAMAASGGYYLASAANKILAERTSIVGSIGVVGGKIYLGEALGELGVNGVVVPASEEPGAGRRAGYLSPLVEWDDATRDRVRESMRSVYELFLRRVAEGRGQPVDGIRPLAEGRIYSGAQGFEKKLIDELGGLGRALAVARSLAKLPRETPVIVEGTGEALLESLLLGDGASEQDVEAAVRRAVSRRALLLDRVPRSLRPFVSGLQPLLEGETTLATLPYAVVIE